jgi:hypothetical protein
MPGEGVVATLRHAWLTFEQLDAPMAVIGGLAISAWNHIRYTRDADLLIAIDDSEIERILTLALAAGFSPKRLPPVLQIDDQKIIQFYFTPPEGLLPFQLDILLAGSEYQQIALQRRSPQVIPGLDHPVDVLRPEDLILLKLYAGRVIDRADAAMLLRENRDEIDFAYLTNWIKRQQLETEYAEIWSEAFPGEAMPKLI